MNERVSLWMAVVLLLVALLFISFTRRSTPLVPAKGAMGEPLRISPAYQPEVVGQRAQANSEVSGPQPSFLTSVREALEPIAERVLPYLPALQPRSPAKRDEAYPLLFPPEYLAFLANISALMQSQGTHPVASSFATNADVLAFLHQMMDFAYSQGYISAENRDKFHRGIDINFELLKREYQSGLQPQGLERSSESFFGAFSIFSQMFLTPSAQAKYQISPECYAERDPENKTPGKNQVTFCCNCGIEGEDCDEFVDDCGDGQCSCANFGCLNELAGGTGNAIWDEDTGICGYD